MGPSINRHTQLDMLALAGTKPVTSSSARPQRLDSPAETLQKNALGKKRARSPEEGVLKDELETGKANLRPDRSLEVGALRLRAVWESPWKRYKKIYDRELAGSVQVAVRREDPIELVHVRKFQRPGSEKALHMFRQLQHDNIVAALEAFTTSDGLYIVLEAMSIPLEQIVKSPAYPDEQQLAAILGQVLNGVAYLMAEGFGHGSLSCSNILLKTDGTLKIANQECCQGIGQSNKSANHDLGALPFIMMELMQKYVKEGGAIGIDDLQRWHPSSDAVKFLSATTSASSAPELLKHPLLAHPWEKGSLIGLVDLGQVCLRGRYKYTPPNVAVLG